MINLSDTQRAVLTAALARRDRCLYPLPGSLKGGAAGKVIGSLLKHGLVEEVPAEGEQSVWRRGDGSTAWTLRATTLAQQVLNGAEEPHSAPVSAAEPAQVPAGAEEPSTGSAVPTSATKRGTAQQALLALLSRPEGATLSELQEATGWQAHSVRGALSGLIKKKLGYQVTSTKEERGRVYRIAS